MDRGRLWMGAVLVALGALFLLQQFGYGNGGATLADWWPLAVIALGLMWFGSGSLRGPLIVTGLGLVLLAGTLGLIAMTFAMLWPLVVVLIGLGFLAGGIGWRRRPYRDENWISQLAVFSGFDIRSSAQRFRGASLTAIFGGFTLDLHDVQLAPEGARVQATTVFGGLTVLVPAGWRVTVSGLPVFGGFSDKTKSLGVPAEDAPHLHVDAVAFFGGVEIKPYEQGRPWTAPAAA
jgi:cell wall-active antibiotic response 4TMS protein YvqF